jgi:hypothetical protein
MQGRNLPFPYAGKHQRIDFWFNPNCPVIEEAITETCNARPAPEKVLKDDGKHMLFVAGQNPVQRFIVKFNLLPRWKDRIRACHCVPEECLCHYRIEKMGIPVPSLWGFFRESHCGVSRRNGIIIAFLKDARNLRLDENLHAVPLLLALFVKGINHPDFMRNNIMLEQSTQKQVLIDLERSSFHAPGDLRILLMNLARYIEYNERPFTHADNQAMIASTYQQLRCPPCSYDAFVELLALLNSRHLSTRQRVGLLLPDDVMTKLRRYSKAGAL